MRLKYGLLWGILLFVNTLTAQNARLDSLEQTLKNHTRTDITQVNLLNDLAYELYRTDAEKSREYADRANKIAEKIHYLKGKAYSRWITGLTLIRSNQTLALDYLRQALKIARETDDKTSICNYLMTIGNITQESGNLEESERSHKEALRTARQIKDKTLIAKSLNALALTLKNKGNHTEALDLLQEALDIAIQAGNDHTQTATYNSMASIYGLQGNYPMALEHYFSALRLNESKNDKPRTTINLINIAGIQSTQKDYESAIKTLNKAFRLSEEMNDSLKMSICLANLGSIHLEMNHPEALSFYQRALATGKQNNISLNINILTNIGSIYTGQKEYDKALQYLQQAMQLAEKTQIRQLYGEIQVKLGSLYLAQKKYAIAIDYTLKALNSARELSYSELQKDCLEQLSTLYAMQQNFRKAYESHVLYQTLADSLFSEKNIREIAKIENSYRNEKEKQEMKMKKAEQEMRIKSQMQIIIFLTVISLLVLALALSIYWSSKLKKRMLKLEIMNINRELKSNQKAVTAATLKLVQHSEQDAQRIKALETIKQNTTEKGQNDIRSLITDYKFQAKDSSWEEFEILFQKVEASFYEKLNENFPNLTMNERKLCVFLKLNMNNKQIAQITFQSEEALKKARLRLRKKLELNREDNLALFIQSL